MSQVSQIIDALEEFKYLITPARQNLFQILTDSFFIKGLKIDEEEISLAVSISSADSSTTPNLAPFVRAINADSRRFFRIMVGGSRFFEPLQSFLAVAKLSYILIICVPFPYYLWQNALIAQVGKI
ncbi:MAG: hypothetical protein QME49_00500 [bacterium]|nr:hypothetical protein [bacterium]